jgi:hypothetical protein
VVRSLVGGEVRSRLVEVIAGASGRLVIGMASSTTSPTRTDQLLGSSSSRTIRRSYVRAADKRDTPASLKCTNKKAESSAASAAAQWVDEKSDQWVESPEVQARLIEAFAAGMQARK